MESATNLLRGVIDVRLVGAKPEAVLNSCAKQGVYFWRCVPVDDYTLDLSVHKKSLPELRQISEKCLCSLEVERKKGAPFYLRRLKRRYTLLVGLGLCLFLLLCSSLFIWDMEVVGNESVSSARILNALEECGVGIGSYWPAFISDSIRSEMLLKVPELSFVTVNVYGSKAEIVVRERVPVPEIVDEDAPTHIIAEKTGIITKITTLRGESLFNVGDAVVEGDTIISGIVGSELSNPRAEHAMGEVQARTWHELTAGYPVKTLEKSYTGKKSSKTALIIGNKRINFYLNSGIYNADCDKIESEAKLELAGVFSLPFKLVRTQYLEYEAREADTDAFTAQVMLQEELEKRLRESVGESGEIVSSEFSVTESNGLLLVTLRAECLEQIDAMTEFDAHSAIPGEIDLEEENNE